LVVVISSAVETTRVEGQGCTRLPAANVALVPLLDHLLQGLSDHFAYVGSSDAGRQRWRQQVLPSVSASHTTGLDFSSQVARSAAEACRVKGSR
jgi:hypothetical protein